MKKYLVGCLIFSAVLVGQSPADMWALNYTTVGGTTVNATITTGAAVTTFESNSGYLITGLTGDRNGVAISLIPTTVDPTVGVSLSPDSLWVYDNVLFENSAFDYWGMLFSDANNGIFNLFRQSEGEYRENNDVLLTGTLERVPEGGQTIALLGGALLGLAALRRRFAR